MFFFTVRDWFVQYVWVKKTKKQDNKFSVEEDIFRKQFLIPTGMETLDLKSLSIFDRFSCYGVRNQVKIQHGKGIFLYYLNEPYCKGNQSLRNVRSSVFKSIAGYSANI